MENNNNVTIVGCYIKSAIEFDIVDSESYTRRTAAVAARGPGTVRGAKLNHSLSLAQEGIPS